MPWLVARFEAKLGWLDVEGPVLHDEQLPLVIQAESRTRNTRATLYNGVHRWDPKSGVTPKVGQGTHTELKAASSAEMRR